MDPGRFTICNDLPMEGYDKESLLGRGACAAGSAQNVESRGPGRPRKSAAVESEHERSPKYQQGVCDSQKQVYNIISIERFLRHIWKWLFR